MDISNRSSDPRNQVIEVIVESIFKMTQIDPSYIDPDHNFKADLDLNEEMVVTIAKQTCHSLSINLPASELNGLALSRTPRQLFERIYSILDHNNQLAA